MEKKYCKIQFKTAVEYDERLNNHTDYVKMLDILESKCSFIGITNEHEIIEEFQKDIIKVEHSNEWWACITSYTETITFIKSSKELFNSLRKYDTFYKNIVNELGYTEIIETNFDLNDIAFYDSEENILLGTCTHEGFTTVTKEIDKKFNS